MDQAFIPECFVDTNLIETLVPRAAIQSSERLRYGNKGYERKVCGQVCCWYYRQRQHAVDYFNEFDEVYNDDSLLLYKHKIKHHYIIQISPAMEQFILSIANAIGLSRQDYQLPSDLTP
ncbi:MAG: hypothetical protein RBS73_00750 [Prolixibacteraceae bacterium]|jgi:hypothetical protein|nr:hypothetical protein [Prolixibacteraceae bacterium]